MQPTIKNLEAELIRAGVAAARRISSLAVGDIHVCMFCEAGEHDVRIGLDLHKCDCACHKS